LDPLRGFVLTALFAGVCAAAGYLLMPLPNVEAFTALLFVAGYTLGAGRGIVAAVVASVIYFGFNPQGGGFPPLLAAQASGAVLSPLAGALFRRATNHRAISRAKRGLLLAACAVAVTFVFDLLTNLAFPLATGQDLRGVMVFLAGGLPFSLVHIISNVAIFILLIPPLLELVKRHHLIDAR